MMTTNAKTLTVAQFARKLRVEPSAIYTAIRREWLIPIPSAGGRIKLSPDDLEAYRREHLGKVGRPSKIDKK